MLTNDLNITTFPHSRGISIFVCFTILSYTITPAFDVCSAHISDMSNEYIIQLTHTCVLMTILYCNTLNEKLFNQLIGIGQKLLWSSSFNYVHSSTNTLSSHMHGFTAIIIYISYHFCVCVGVCVDDKLLLGFAEDIIYSF